MLDAQRLGIAIIDRLSSTENESEANFLSVEFF